MHPGPQCENSVIRWTAPSSGSYRIKGSFAGNNFAYPTTTDTAILHNSVETFSGSIESYMMPLYFDQVVLVDAGDTIDFTVGCGSDGGYEGDATGLSATISLNSSGNVAGSKPYGVMSKTPVARPGVAPEQ